MSVEKLEHFVNVVKCGSFVRAADMLHLHQSTLSKSISSLESLLGVQLILYNNGKMTLTNAGEKLFTDAPSVVDGYNKLISATQNMPDELGGTLTFCYQAFFIPAISEAYTRFSAFYPDVQWSADVYSKNDTAKIENMVVGNIYDIGIVSKVHYSNSHSQLSSSVLYTSRFVLLVSKNNPLAEKKSISLTDLAGNQFLMCRTMLPEIYENLNSLLIQNNLPPVNVVYVDKRLNKPPWDEFLFMQVGSDSGVTIIPELVGRHFTTECVMLDIVDFRAPYDVLMIWRKDNTNPALHQFLNIVKKPRDRFA